MAEKKEQIRIEADFDASKLDLKSKAALDKLQQSTEKVSQSVKNTANSFNDLSNKINKAGQTTQNATNNIVRNLKNVERQAGKTGNALNRMGQGGPHGNTQTLEPSGSMGMGADTMLLGSMLGRGNGALGAALKAPTAMTAAATSLRRSVFENILAARKAYFRPEKQQFIDLNKRKFALLSSNFGVSKDTFDFMEKQRKIFNIQRYYGLNDAQMRLVRMDPEAFNKAGFGASLKGISTAAGAPAINPNSFREKWGGMDFGGKLGAVGMAGMLMAPMVGSLAKGLGASDSGAELSQNAFSGIIGGATGLGAILGPTGAIAGALLGAGTALVNAALKQKQAAEMIIENYKQTKSENQDTFANYKSNKYQREFYGRQKAMLDDAVKEKDYDKAKAILERRIEDRKKVRDDLYGQISKNTTGVHRVWNEEKADWVMKQGWWTILDQMRGKTDGKKMMHTEDEYHLLQKGIATYLPDSYDIKGLKNGVAVMEELDSELDNLRDQLKKLTDAETAEAAAAAAAAAEEAADEAERIKQEQEDKEAEAKRKKYEKLTEEGDAWTSMASLMDKMAGNVTSNGDSAKGRLSGYRLTDSLTSMGAGKGYYGQMNGVANEVSRISKAVNKAVDLIDKFKALFESYAADKYKDAATFA